MIAYIWIQNCSWYLTICFIFVLLFWILNSAIKSVASDYIFWFFFFYSLDFSRGKSQDICPQKLVRKKKNITIFTTYEHCASLFLIFKKTVIRLQGLNKLQLNDWLSQMPDPNACPFVKVSVIVCLAKKVSKLFFKALYICIKFCHDKSISNVMLKIVWMIYGAKEKKRERH